MEAASQNPDPETGRTRLEQAETRAENAEARTEQAKTRTEAAETRTEAAETRAENAENRTESAKTRAEQAEIRAEQAETRVEQAEAMVEALVETLGEGQAEPVPPATSPADGAELRALERMTSRQREVLQLIATGENTKQIAGTLAISPKTVEYHRKKLMDGLDIHDVPGLVRFAVRVGLVGLVPANH